MKRFAQFTVLAVALALVGCDTAPTEVEDYSPQAVMYCYLYGGEPFERLYLERVQAFNPRYDTTAAGIVGATVTITDEHGVTRTLVDEAGHRGAYIATTPFTVDYRTKYSVEARISSSETLTASTMVPGPIVRDAFFLSADSGRTQRLVTDGMELQIGPEYPYWVWEPVDSAGGYAGVIETQMPIDSLVPLDPKRKIEKDEKLTRAGWTVTRPEQSIISLSWLWFQWVGRTKVEFEAISKEYYDYLFSDFRVRQGALDKPVSNVRGGLGVVGGVVRKSMMVVMKRN